MSSAEVVSPNIDRARQPTAAQTETSFSRFLPFQPLSEEERARQFWDITKFILERDGKMDYFNRTLSKREQFLKEIAVDDKRIVNVVDRLDFFKDFYGKRTHRRSILATWLLTVAKSNEAERYGVGIEFQKFLQKDLSKIPEIDLYTLLEETYHTKFLLEICNIFGISPELRTPSLSIRSAIFAMSRLPDPIRFAAVLCGETVGSIVFQAVRSHAASLLQPWPETAKAVDDITKQIVIDEVIHAALCRARLAPSSIRLAKAISPLVLFSVMRDLPELEPLGLSKTSLRRTIAEGIEIPDELSSLQLATH